MENSISGIDWNNIDLNSPYECDLHLLDPLKFSDLLLEINCNLPKISAESVRAQFRKDLQSRVDEAKEIFEANLPNIVRHALSVRREA